MNKTLEQLPDNVIAGLEAFRKKEFYSAHEYFEDAWRKTLGTSREFYRALLHLSGGFFRLTQSRPGAAKKILHTCSKMARVLSFVLCRDKYRSADIPIGEPDPGNQYWNTL